MTRNTLLFIVFVLTAPPGPPPPSSAAEQAAAEVDAHAERKRIIDLIRNAKHDRMERLAERMELCGHHTLVLERMATDGDEATCRSLQIGCRSRLCAICAAKRRSGSARTRAPR